MTGTGDFLIMAGNVSAVISTMEAAAGIGSFVGVRFEGDDKNR